MRRNVCRGIRFYVFGIEEKSQSIFTFSGFVWELYV